MFVCLKAALIPLIVLWSCAAHIALPEKSIVKLPRISGIGSDTREYMTGRVFGFRNKIEIGDRERKKSGILAEEA